MTNGIDHNQGNGGNSEKPSAPPKPDTKSSVPAKPQPVQVNEQSKQ